MVVAEAVEVLVLVSDVVMIRTVVLEVVWEVEIVAVEVAEVEVAEVVREVEVPVFEIVEVPVVVEL